MPTNKDANLLNASWLLKLRWVAVVGQLSTIASVQWGLGIPLPTGSLMIIIGVTAISNGLLTYIVQLRRHDPAIFELQLNSMLGLVSVMDMLSLTALLYATGGVTNPFWMFFFVNLCLSSALLQPRWAWTINGLANACFVLLLFDYRALPALDLGIGLEPVRWTGRWTLLHLGLILAFAACSSISVYFLTRLTSALRQQERDLRRAQQIQSDSEKLDALGTLAAGTAHELATPLSTIAVVAREVEKAVEQRLSDFPDDADLVNDVHLIRSELDRCRKILDRMASHSGQTVGEVVRPWSWQRVWSEIVDSIVARDRVRLHCDFDLAAYTIQVPLGGFSQAVRGLIQNGLDASEPEGIVDVTLVIRGDHWVMTIQDLGIGMTPAILKRISEPFFTTKPPGKGMGLGVFLARSLIQRLGGEMSIDSKVGAGSSVQLTAPVADSVTAP